MKQAFSAAFVVAVSFWLPAFADSNHGEKGRSAQGAAMQTGAMADGEVRKVDKDAQKITLRHGPLPQLDMPRPMTMVYRVKDPAMLDKVKPGDKVTFEAENISGAFTLTRIEPAK